MDYLNKKKQNVKSYKSIANKLGFSRDDLLAGKIAGYKLVEHFEPLTKSYQ